MSDAALTAEDVRSATFNKPPRGKRGYDEKSVNDFLQLAARRLDGSGHLSAADVRGGWAMPIHTKATTKKTP